MGFQLQMAGIYAIHGKFGAIIVFGPHDSYDQYVNNLEREEMPLFGISKLMCSSNVLSLILVKDRNQHWAYA